MFRKYTIASVMAILISSILLVSGNSNVTYAVECEDIKGEMDWGSEDHDDNNPSEKKFYKVLEEKTFCEVNKMIDHEEVEGEIKEDTKHDIDWLRNTIYYQSVDEEVQDCIDDAYFDSPDGDGDDNAADYEMLECGY